MSEVRELGGEIYGISAQGRKTCKRTQKTWRLNFTLMSNPNHSLINYLKASDVLKVEVCKNPMMNPNVIRYRHGMIQPGVLLITRDGVVVYSWSSVGGVTNLFGTTDRPSVRDVWYSHKPSLLEALNLEMGGNTEEKGKIRKKGMFSVLKDIPIPLKDIR